MDVSGLLAGTMILDHGVGLEYIASYLAAPLYLLHLALDVRHMLHALAFLDLKELAAQHSHCRLAVLYLAALVLALHDHSRREVR